MSVHLQRILVVLLAAVLMLTGCGPGGLKTPTTRTPKATRTWTLAPTIPPTETPVFIPTAPPLPSLPSLTVSKVVLNGWEDIEISHLCLSDRSSGVDPRPEKIDVYAMFEKYLEAVGIQVSSGTNSACDGTLTIKGQALPKSANYSPGGLCYTGYSIELQIIFAAQGKQEIFTISRSKPTPNSVTACPKNPENAPFPDLNGKVMEILRQIWGDPFVLASLAAGDWDDQFIDYAKQSAPGDAIKTLVISTMNDEQNYAQALELVRFWHMTEAIPFLHTYIHAPGLKEHVIVLMAETLCSLDDLTMNDVPPILAVIEAGKVFDQHTYLFSCVNEPEAALRVLVDALEDADDVVSRTIVANLAEFGELAYDHLIPMLDDSHLREEVEKMLSRQGYQVIAPLIEFSQVTDNAQSRKAIPRILKEVSRAEKGKSLEDWQTWWLAISAEMDMLQLEDYAAALISDEYIMRVFALEKIIEAGPAAMDTLPNLSEMLGKENFYLTTLALGHLGPEGLQVVIEYLATNPRRNDNYGIYRALAELGPDAVACVPVLITNLSVDPDMMNPDNPNPAIIRALAGISGQNFGKNAGDWQAWWAAND